MECANNHINKQIWEAIFVIKTTTKFHMKSLLGQEQFKDYIPQHFRCYSKCAEAPTEQNCQQQMSYEKGVQSSLKLICLGIDEGKNLKPCARNIETL